MVGLVSIFGFLWQVLRSENSNEKLAFIDQVLMFGYEVVGQSVIVMCDLALVVCTFHLSRFLLVPRA